MAAFALFASPASAQSTRAAQPTHLQPTGNWVVDYAESMCVLQREYGTARRPLTLGIRPSLMEQTLKLVVVETGSGGHKFDVPATVSFGDGGLPVQTKFARIALPGRSIRLNETSVQRSDLNRAIATGRIALQAPQAIDVQLAVPALGPALKVLDECVADLLDGWGLSRLEQASLASLARPLGGKLAISSQDYPRAALDSETSGSTVARVAVGPDGGPSDCTVLVSSGSRDLDNATCKGLLRSRFEPAINKAGAAVASLHIAEIVWRIWSSE